MQIDKFVQPLLIVLTNTQASADMPRQRVSVAKSSSTNARACRKLTEKCFEYIKKLGGFTVAIEHKLTKHS